MKAISLFTGAGGMDVGFQHAGYEVVWANELMPHAAATYALNHPDGVMRCGDLNKFMDQLPKDEDIFCVFGGPPCQGFSVAGKMDLDDERSKLVFAFMDVVTRVNPKAFVMENVKALAALSKFSHIREELVRRAMKLGYNAEFHVLNSKDFGVPQARERVFFIGIRRDSGVSFNSGLLDRHRKPAPTLRTLFAAIGPAGTDANPMTCKAKITLAERPVMRKSPYAGMIFNGMGRPLRIDGVSYTLPASMGGNKTPIVDEAHVFKGTPSWVESYHARLMDGEPPLNMNDASPNLRRLTLREAAAIQSFPESYKFSGPVSSVYTQIGNAVPCQLAGVVAASVREAFEKIDVMPKRGQQELMLAI